MAVRRRAVGWLTVMMAAAVLSNGTPGTLQGASGDEEHRLLAHGQGQPGHREGAEPDPEDRCELQAVGELPAEHEAGSAHDEVGQQHPRALGRAGAEVADGRGEGDAQHRRVEPDEHRGREDDGEHRTRPAQVHAASSPGSVLCRGRDRPTEGVQPPRLVVSSLLLHTWVQATCRSRQNRSRAAPIGSRRTP